MPRAYLSPMPSGKGYAEAMDLGVLVYLFAIAFTIKAAFVIHGILTRR
jgi:hypothetical protein